MDAKRKEQEKQKIVKAIEDAIVSKEHEDLELSNVEISIEESKTVGETFIVTIKKHNGYKNLRHILDAMQEATWGVKRISVLPICPSHLTNQNITLELTV
ncbi:Uncharacterised protein [uncultured archaeon]|nr:Uncharacterised protein [uncultured archaeon]